MAYNFSEEELEQLKSTMAGIGSYLPTNKTGYIWSTYKKIVGTNEPQPCTCKSSASLWAKAVQTINDFLKKLEK